jgi:REP element-mobilizing transposase RayT
MPHATRAHFKKLPAHVTLRLREDAPSLRTVRVVRELERTFAAGCERPGFRLVHYSLQGNHAHLIVEAQDRDALGRGMKAIGARLARAVNRVAKRMGPVLAERYHHRVLSTPKEVLRGPPPSAQCTAPHPYGPSGAHACRSTRSGVVGALVRWVAAEGTVRGEERQLGRASPGRPRPQLALDDRMAAARLAGSRRRPRLMPEREQRSLDRG